MAKLSVNVNKLATLRNARGGNVPDLVKTSLDIIRFGAQGITVHPRPDGRHIRRQDVYDLKKAINVEFNIEGYPSKDFLDLVCDVVPEQCTLVPDPPDVITSNAGWKVAEKQEILSEALDKLKSKKIRVSLFIDPFDVSESDLDLIGRIGADRIELYTEAYARAFAKIDQDEVVKTYTKVAKWSVNRSIGLNAGHDLDLKNLSFLIKQIPEIKEVSIGHALICDALYLGLEETIKSYLACCTPD